jgi:hypothetical protein
MCDPQPPTFGRASVAEWSGCLRRSLSLSLGLSLCALCQPKLPKKREGECMDRAPLTYGHAPTATLGSHSAVRLPCAVLCSRAFPFGNLIKMCTRRLPTNRQTLKHSNPRPGQQRTLHSPFHSRKLLVLCFLEWYRACYLCCLQNGHERSGLSQIQLEGC